MKHDAFEQVAKGHVVIFGESLENLEQTFFHTDACLHALDKKLRIIDHGNNVPWYTIYKKPNIQGTLCRFTQETWQAASLPVVYLVRAGARIRILLPGAPLFSIVTLPWGLSIVTPSEIE